MLSNKYKQAWHRFINSWNSRWNFEHFWRETKCIVKLIALSYVLTLIWIIQAKRSETAILSYRVDSNLVQVLFYYLRVNEWLSPPPATRNSSPTQGARCNYSQANNLATCHDDTTVVLSIPQGLVRWSTGDGRVILFIAFRYISRKWCTDFLNIALQLTNW